jgi:hypothetical protein
MQKDNKKRDRQVCENSGNEIRAVRLCGGDDYVTRKFEDSRLAQPFIESASNLVAQLEAGEIAWKQAKEDF